MISQATAQTKNHKPEIPKLYGKLAISTDPRSDRKVDENSN